MKSVVIGSTVYSNGNSSFSLESAKVTGISVIKDPLNGVCTWIALQGDDEERSISSDVFFKNYKDAPPFFKIGFTYRNVNNASDVKYHVTELLKSDEPTSSHDIGLYAVAKRRRGVGGYSYVILDEASFGRMVQV